MNEQATPSYGAVPADSSWLTVSFVLIAIGVLLALFILARGARLAAKRRQTRAEVSERNPLPTHDAPAPEIAAPTMPEPTAAPEPAPLADEPIAAAAPLEASPATLAVATAATPAPASKDDLTRLKGVGPKLAARLGELGITSFAALAALDGERAQALDAQLGSFQGRITRDRWIEQARLLAAGDTAGYEAVFGKL
jgi:predicted flap endonuclease-1-like 5' DNA nuclease